MKPVQFSQISSIYTVTSSISIINSLLELKSNDSKQDEGKPFQLFFHILVPIHSFIQSKSETNYKRKIQLDPIHLMGTFLNSKIRKMKYLYVRQEEECIEYIKQQMLLFDVDNHVKSFTCRKES